jgi:hypothetical protein
MSKRLKEKKYFGFVESRHPLEFRTTDKKNVTVDRNRRYPKLVEKNKQIRLTAAKKTIQQLDTKSEDKLD